MTATADRLEKPAGHAPLIVLACTVGLIFNIATLFNGSMTSFIKPIAEEFGWSRTQVSSGVSFAMVSLLIAIPMLGRLCDRIGPRRVALVGAPAFAVGMGLLSLTPNNYYVYALLCVVLGIAGAGSYNTVFYAVLPRWFNKRLGLAVGIVSAGTGLGLMLAPVAAEFLIDNFSWRQAYIVLGALSFVMTFPLVLFVLRDNPPTQTRTAGPSAVALEGDTAAEALRRPMFWRVAASYFLTGLAINGTLVHLVPMLTDAGMTPESAALTASVLGLAVLASRVASGFALDYVDAGRLGAASFLIAVGGFVLLIGAPSNTEALIAVLLIGTALGSEGGILTYVTRRVFGTRAYGAIVGLVMSAFLTGVLAGPIAMGAAFDLTGSYHPAQYAFVAMAVLAALLHVGVTRLPRAAKA